MHIPVNVSLHSLKSQHSEHYKDVKLWFKPPAAAASQSFSIQHNNKVTTDIVIGHLPASVTVYINKSNDKSSKTSMPRLLNSY